LQIITEGASGFHRVDYRFAPHNLFYWLSAGYGDAQWYGFATALDNPPTLEFLEFTAQTNATVETNQSLKSRAASSTASSPALTNPPAVSVSQLVVPFSEFSVAQWQWTGSGSDGCWLRSMDGPTIDALDNAQIRATNVVVLWASHTPDASGGTTWEINLNGSGRASVFTQGGRIDGTWQTNGSTPPRFQANNGEVIYLTPGNTWFQVLPPEIDVSAW